MPRALLLADEKAFNIIFFAWTALLYSSINSSKYAASKILRYVLTVFEFLYGSYYTYVSALIVFVVTLTIQYYYCIPG